MRRIFEPALLTLATLVVGIACAACSADSGPSAGTYTVQFPSVAAAVAVDTVEVAVFDASSTPESICAQLILGVKSNDIEQKPITSGPAESPCDMEAGKDPVTLGYGTRAILALGTKGGVPLLAGCTVETIGAGSLPVNIDMGLVNTANAVPSTQCTRLSDFCSGKCQ